MESTERKRAGLMILGRSDYSACMLQILNDTGVSRTMAGMVSSSFALCNAFGQLGAAVVMRKVSALKVICVEIFTVFAINLLFPLTNSFGVMAMLCGSNGTGKLVQIRMGRAFYGALHRRFGGRRIVPDRWYLLYKGETE